MNAPTIQLGVRPPAPLLVDLKETARLLSVSVVTVRRIIKRGELPIIPVGDLVRVSRMDIVEFIAKRRTERRF